MINLLKADFFRVLRTKIVYISLIVAVGLPLFIAGTFALSGVGAYTPEEMEMMKYTYGNMLMTAPFSSLLSFSFVFAIFPVIVIIMDFGNGTMRDKIIHGYTRHQIYAAHFIITFAYVFLLTLLYTLTTTGCALLMFKVSDIDASMVASYAYYYIIGFVNTLISASLGTCLALSLAGAGSIVLTVVGKLLLDNIYLLVALAFSTNGGNQNNEVAKHVLSFFPCYVTGLVGQAIIEPSMFVEALGGIFIISGALYALGTFVFSIRDFK